MSQLFPSRERLAFVICEDVREEVGNKLTFIGVYAGGSVLLSVDREREIYVVPAFALFFGFRDGEGIFDGKFSLIDPDGEEIASDDLGKLKKDKSAMNFFSVFKPMRFKKLGTYVARVYLDNEKYEGSFDVDRESDGN